LGPDSGPSFWSQTCPRNWPSRRLAAVLLHSIVAQSPQACVGQSRGRETLLPAGLLAGPACVSPRNCPQKRGCCMPGVVLNELNEALLCLNPFGLPPSTIRHPAHFCDWEQFFAARVPRLAQADRQFLCLGEGGQECRQQFGLCTCRLQAPHEKIFF
jgi:hypothetical protein